MPPKISIVYLLDKLAFGGTPLQVMELALHLDDEKFQRQFVVLAQIEPELQRSLEPRGIACHLLGRGHWVQAGAWRELYKLHRIFKQLQPNIIHAFLPTSNVLGATLGKLARVPVRISSHRDLGGFDGERITRVNNWTDRHLAQCVTANSGAVQQAVLTRTRLAPENVRVLYNGVDVEQLKRAQRGPAKREELGFAETDLLFAVVANIRAAKGHRDALAAFLQIAPRFPHARLLLCGYVADAEVFRELQRMVAAARAERQVHFMDSRKDMPEIMHAIDVLIAPSHSEGFSNAILEAMTAGKPVVASAVGGNCEQIVHERTGYLFPCGDAQTLAGLLEDLAAAPGKREHLGTAGAARVNEMFSVQAMTAAHEKLYEDLIRRRAKKKQ
ncbi:MAG: glycosyltransferase [candidate division KSB1 bacterium]